MPKKNGSGNLISLRQRAEELLEKSKHDFEPAELENYKTVLHELKVHQVELELQNEELRSAQEKLAASRNKYFELFDLAPVGYFTLDLNGIIKGVNLTGAELLSRAKSILLERPFSNYVAPDFHKTYFEHKRRVLESQNKQRCELRLILEEEKSIFALMESVVIPDNDATFNKVLVTLFDITEQKEREDALQRLLKEKEVLLKEIHHRVKNNLQIIASLVNIQMKRIEVPEARQYFRECHQRIQSMTLIHETLYGSESLADIDFAKYVRRLVSYLLQTYTHLVSNLEVNYRISKGALPVDIAIPCGLILTELVSNALKHAFRENASATLHVIFSNKSPERYRLAVRDNGVGLPQNVTVEDADSVGFTLIRALVAQLNGTVTIDRQDGTEVQISFPRFQNTN